MKMKQGFISMKFIPNPIQTKIPSLMPVKGLGIHSDEAPQAGLDGDRISREQAEADRARRAAESAQARLFNPKNHQ